MVKVYIVDSENDEESAWGPFTDKSLADLVLKIVQMTIDEGAEIKERELNPYAQIKDGLKPWKIWATIDSETQVSTGNHVELQWPPGDVEGIVERRDDYMECFVWAPSSGEAIIRMSQLNRAHAESEAKKESEQLIAEAVLEDW